MPTSGTPTGRKSGLPTRSSGSTARSNAASTLSASSPTPMRCCACRRACGSKPTRSGKTATGATYPKSRWHCSPTATDRDPTASHANQTNTARRDPRYDIVTPNREVTRDDYTTRRGSATATCDCVPEPYEPPPGAEALTYMNRSRAPHHPCSTSRGPRPCRFWKLQDVRVAANCSTVHSNVQDSGQTFILLDRHAADIEEWGSGRA